MGALTSVDPNALATGEATIPRDLASNTAVTLVGSGTVIFTFFTARKTESINNLRMICGGTAASATPTLVRAGVYTLASDGALTLGPAIASDTSIFAAANTSYTRALTATWSKIADVRYAIGLLVVSSQTMPTGVGVVPLIAAEMAQPPRGGAILTGQSDLPSSVAAASLVDNARRLYVAMTP